MFPSICTWSSSKSGFSFNISENSRDILEIEVEEVKGRNTAVKVTMKFR